MELTTLFMLAFFTMLTKTNAKNYSITEVLDEKIMLFTNHRFQLDVDGFGDDAVIYMTINEPITEDNDLWFTAEATRFDGVKFPLPTNPIRLCDLLSNDAIYNNKHLAQFQMSRIFNLDGMTCPIPPGKRRLRPYMFPPTLQLQNDIGCGNFNYETTIGSCTSNDAEALINCRPLISAETIVYLGATDCSNTLA